MFNANRIAAAVAGALVAGVVLGSAVSGYAATAVTTGTATGTCTTGGIRLGIAMRAGGGRLLDVVAKLTGYSAAEVHAKRAAGKTFAQIADDSNVNASAIVGEALKIRQSMLADKVEAGTITQSQADAALKNMESRLKDRVNTANANCDGTGSKGAGRGNGRGAGNRNGTGAGGGNRGSGACGNCTVTSAQ